MRCPLHLLGFDFGASSGRAMHGAFDGEKLSVAEIHRFSNDPVRAGNTLYWDVLRLLHEMRQSMLCACEKGIRPVSIGIDTWGVDFGLISKQGAMLSNPVHYRDARTDGVMELAEKTLSKEQIFMHTGLAFMGFNTLYQLMALQNKEPELLAQADKLLFMPDLFSYFLTGEMGTEYTIASTSQLTNPRTRDWSGEILDAFDIPESLFTEIQEPGAIRGTLRASICKEVGLEGRMQIVAGPQHDTAAAVAAAPASEKDFAYISSGTWSLLGVETKSPIVSKGVLNANYTNEGGICGTTRVLKNIMGMWILQECRRHWAMEGIRKSYDEIVALAQQEAPFRSLFDPDDARFMPPGNMPERICAYCRETGQPIPETAGQFARAIYESLALKYRWSIRRLEKEIIGRTIPCIHVVGGGSRNALFNQMTADAADKPVIAGPGEATVIGNLLMQAMALGEIADLQQLRAVVRASFETVAYQPHHSEAWEEAYGKFLAMAKLED